MLTILKLIDNTTINQMNPSKEALPYIRSNCEKYGIEWVNKGRISEDFKFLIFGRPNQGKQIGIYGRQSTIIRLQQYNQNITGVEIQQKCATSHAAEASFSNFNKGKGVCVKVENNLALKNLLDWYFEK